MGGGGGGGGGKGSAEQRVIPDKESSFQMSGQTRKVARRLKRVHLFCLLFYFCLYFASLCFSRFFVFLAIEASPIKCQPLALSKQRAL